MTVRVRKAGENDFNKDTKQYWIEVYRDLDAGNLVYISETGSIAVVPGANPPPAKIPDPLWKGAMNLKARKADEKDFTGSTKAYGIEVFSDEINKNLLYITETGSIGVVPGEYKPGDMAKSPEWKAAMALRVRKGGDPDFNDKTPRTGIEVFLDTVSGKLLLLTETGNLNVPLSLQSSGKGGPEWKYGLDLKVRKAEENDFSKARSYGVEIFLDEATGGLIYITDSGAVATSAK